MCSADLPVCGLFCLPLFTWPSTIVKIVNDILLIVIVFQAFIIKEKQFTMHLLVCYQHIFIMCRFFNCSDKQLKFWKFISVFLCTISFFHLNATGEVQQLHALGCLLLKFCIKCDLSIFNTGRFVLKQKVMLAAKLPGFFVRFKGVCSTANLAGYHVSCAFRTQVIFIKSTVSFNSFNVMSF